MFLLVAGSPLTRQVSWADGHLPGSTDPEADAAYEAGDHELALVKYEQAAESCPEDPHYVLGHPEP